VLCTEKDAVKLWKREPDALAVPLEFEPEPAFWQALEMRLAQLLAH
jgi:tetraacyldisaccharide 4'-kinase